LQLKGAGVTPYSRRGDGRAVLRSSIREYLASEAMAALGVPTSRALSLAVSLDDASVAPVWRDRYYDGNVLGERAAVVARIAPSWLRFGTLEFLHRRGEHHLLRDVVQWMLREHPYHFDQLGDGSYDYERAFGMIAQRTARMAALWQAVGFCHGVLNTDNLSLHGITIDFGPFGFIDAYDEDHVCNYSDRDERRYAFGKQQEVVHGNLLLLADVFADLIATTTTSTTTTTATTTTSVAAVRQRLERRLKEEWYVPTYTSTYISKMRAKIGYGDDVADGVVIDTVGKLLEVLQQHHLDYHYFFLLLEKAVVEASPLPLLVLLDDSVGGGDGGGVSSRNSGSAAADLSKWFEDLYLPTSGTINTTIMQHSNPRIVLRNHIADIAIHAAEDHDDFSEVDTLAALLRDPYLLDDRHGCSPTATTATDDAARCAALLERYGKPPQSPPMPVSCSS